MELYTRRLILRRWKESDAENLFEYAKDCDVGALLQAGRRIKMFLKAFRLFKMFFAGQRVLQFA